jgi:hypothetical protein
MPLEFMAMLEIARVIAVHWESHTVDVALLSDGRRLFGVRTMSGAATTNTGFNDMASPALGGGSKDKATEVIGERESAAVIGFIGGIPVCLGFLFPHVSQLMFEDADRMVYRHASDVYLTIDKAGNTEVYHPSGTFLRIGETPAHEDLTGRDFDKLWKISKNTNKAVHVHLSVKNAGAEVASLNIDPGGNIVEKNVGNLSADIGGNLTASVGGNASATVGGTTDVTSGGNMTLTAPTITLNGNTVINGPLTQGKGGAGGNCQMLGPLNVINDVTAGSISLMGHVHPENDFGGPTSPPSA